MNNEQLSRDFWLSEFTVSQEAARQGRLIVPSPEEAANLRRLCTQVLQPLRDHFQRPIFVSSGLRPHWLNQLIGGASSSMHVYGCAADIKVSGVDDITVCSAVRGLGLPIDQCILEFPPTGWVHLGIERVGAERRGMFLTARSLYGATQYFPGIHL